MRTVHFNRIALLLAAALVLPATSDAQQAGSTAPDAETRRKTEVESITVTAERREESLQDASLSVSAFGSDDLEKLEIHDVQNLTGWVPGVVFTQSTSGGASQLYLRGIGQGDFHSGFRSKVAMYADGVYIANQSGNLSQFEDLERIEVMRGPQATLWGRNTTGGAVRFISNKPHNELGAKAKIRAGQHGRFDAIATLNVPLVGETLLGRFNVLRTRRDALYTNWNPVGKDLNEKDRWGARGQLQLNATDDFQVNYAFEHFESDEQGPLFQVINPDAADFGRSEGNCGLPFFSRRRGDPVCITDDTFGKIKTTQHSVVMGWDLGDTLHLESTTGWRRQHQANSNDLDGNKGIIIHSENRAQSRSFQQELVLTGSALEDLLDFTFGAGWFEDENFFTGRTLRTGSTATNFRGDNYSWGVYTQQTLHVTEKLALTGGIRYDHERRQAGITEEVVLTGVPSFAASESLRSDAWSPLAKAEYNWTDDLMTYVLWSRGFAAAAFNARIPRGFSATVLEQITSTPADQEELSSWEAGVKSAWFDNRLIVNMSGYYNDFKDIQVATLVLGPQVPGETPSTGSALSNAARARMRGVELEARANPIPGLDIQASYTLQYLDYRKFRSLETRGEGEDQEIVIVDIADTQKFALQPTRWLSASVSYEFPPLPSVGVPTLAVNMVRKGRFPVAGRYQNTHALYGVRAQLDDFLGRDGLKVAVVGQNISDREYFSNGVDLGRWVGVNWGDPREIFAEVSYEWGGENR